MSNNTSEADSSAKAPASTCGGICDGRLLSVVMPSFRLAETIADNIRRVDSVLSSLDIPHEIVAVDDGSGDGTEQIFSGLSHEFSASGRNSIFIPVVLPLNGGKGNALRAGAKASHGDLILLLDADLDLSPDMAPVFINTMCEKNADIVIGSKRHPDSIVDYPLSRRIASRIYYGLVHILTGLPVTDTQVGMKLFRREALLWALDRMLVKRFAFDVELLSIAFSAGYKLAEAPVKMQFGNKLGALTFDNVKTVLNDTLAIFYRLRIMRYYQSVVPVELATPPPKTSIIIACPGDSRYLRETLRGIAAQTISPCETIILPDLPFSTESSDSALDAIFPLSEAMRGNVASPPLRVIPTGKVRPAEKRNCGIAEANGDIIAFLDDDTEPERQWLAQALRHFSRSEIGATGGPAVTPSSDSRMARLGGDVFASRLVSGPARFRYYPDRYRSVDDLPSCNLLVRSSLLREIGGFSIRYWPGEDTILCLDIVNRGFKILYDPFATVRHHRRPLYGPHLRQVGRYALHRGFFARRFPRTSLRISYMIPSLFTIGLISGGVVAWRFSPLRIPYLSALSVYVFATLIASFHRNICDWFLVWLGVVLTHIWYGIRFMQGLLFGNMPESVRAFDHGEENANLKIKN